MIDGVDLPFQNTPALHSGSIQGCESRFPVWTLRHIPLPAIAQCRQAQGGDRSHSDALISSEFHLTQPPDFRLTQPIDYVNLSASFPAPFLCKGVCFGDDDQERLGPED